MSFVTKYRVIRAHTRSRQRGIMFATREAAEHYLNNDILPNKRIFFKVEEVTYKDKSVEQRMTCQCCGGSFLAKTGFIAHHGYKRPGDGWQTASCYGARHLPFENDHHVLDMLILNIEHKLDRLKVSKVSVENDEGFSITMEDLTKPRQSFRSRPQVTLQFTPSNFEEISKTYASSLRRITVYDYQDAKRAKLVSLDRAIGSTISMLRELNVRRGLWKLTHKYNQPLKTWEPV